MNDFHRSNKISGIHWLNKSIEELIIRIKIKPLDGILTLPKFEDYINETNGDNINLEQKTDEHIFKWQQKVFSKGEIRYYGDINNCNTDREKKYLDIINTQCEPSKIYTYLHEDSYLPLPPDFKNLESNSVLNLNPCLESLSIQGAVEKVTKNELGTTISQTNLLKSEENLVEEQWTAMHIVFDNSDYDEDSNIVIKKEVSLLSIFYNTTHNFIILSPDNNTVFNPYIVEDDLGVSLNYQYEVNVFFENKGSDELLALLTKLYKKWERKHKHLVNFIMSPLGRKKYYVSLEILSATDFDMDNLYIEYTIKIPDTIQCNDDVHGKTHVCEALKMEQSETWNYGHIIELNMESDNGIDPPPIKLFLEAISVDWWCRHRTEGYGYLALTLQPGHYTKQLSCSRPEEKDKIEADSRRFFVGGCHLIKDLDVLAQPQTVDTKFIYHTTGTINLRWRVMSQSPTPGMAPLPPHPGTSSASDLLQGAEVALRKYRKARARLAAATKDLEVTYEELGG